MLEWVGVVSVIVGEFVDESIFPAKKMKHFYNPPCWFFMFFFLALTFFSLFLKMFQIFVDC